MKKNLRHNCDWSPQLLQPQLSRVHPVQENLWFYGEQPFRWSVKHHIIHPVEKPYIFGVIRLPYNLSYQTTTEICFTFPLEGSTTLSRRLASVDFPAPVRPTRPTFNIRILLNANVNIIAGDLQPFLPQKGWGWDCKVLEVGSLRGSPSHSPPRSDTTWSFSDQPRCDNAW